MDVSSWLRRHFLSSNRTTTAISDQKPLRNVQQADEQILGLTDRLIDLVDSFTLETFKNFNLSDYQQPTVGDDSPTTSGNVRNDLSEWQQRHATQVLLKVKKLSQLRYRLCPGYMKEDEFWRIYFYLVKSHIAQFELQAIRLVKIRERALENGKPGDKNACEVEMAETKSSVKLPLPDP